MRKLTAIEKSAEKFEEIPVSKLKKGDRFLFRKSQRSLRVFEKRVELNSEVLRPEHKGKVLLFFNGCANLLMSPDEKIFIHKAK